MWVAGPYHLHCIIELIFCSTSTDVMQETMQQMMAELKQMKIDLRELKQ